MERLLDRIENIENKIPILLRISDNQGSDKLIDTYHEALLFVSNKLEELRRSPHSSTLLDVDRNIDYRRYLQIKSHLVESLSRFNYSRFNYSSSDMELY